MSAKGSMDWPILLMGTALMPGTLRGTSQKDSDG